jgi:sulfate-transporting ATPase
MNSSIPPGPRLGDKVLEVSHLRKSYGDRVLIDDLSFSSSISTRSP